MVIQKQFDRFRALAERSIDTHPYFESRGSLHFCFIFKKNRLYVMGVNSHTTHPKTVQKWNMVHAEFDALNRFSNLYGFDPYKLSAFVLRLNQHGEVRMSKPCATCMVHLKDSGIKNIFYSANNNSYLKLVEI